MQKARALTPAKFAALGHIVVRYGLALAWIGAMKFTAFEAESIRPLIQTSPLVSWLYRIFDLQTVSNLLGIGEIAAGAMLALRPYSAKLTAVGSAFAVLMFLTTFSFLFSLPGWEPSLGGFPALSGAGGFLVKDICLLGAALWSLGEALSALQIDKSNTKPSPPRSNSGGGEIHMRKLRLIGLLAVFDWVCGFSVAAFAQPQPAQPLQTISIVRFDPLFDKLVPLNVKVERIVGGRKWAEGPVWDRRHGYLLFSDIPDNAVIKWQEGKGASVFLKRSGYSGKSPFKGPEPGSNGLALDPQGKLVLAEHGDRRIARLESNGLQTTLVDRFDGKRINSPNDLVFKSNGDLYFTDPPFGLPKSYNDPAKETPFQGVYRYGKDGKLTLLTKEVKAPNGIAFSPDEKKLYVSNADPLNAVWLVYDVKPDGTIESGRVFYDGTAWAKTSPGVPDGMKVDRNGNIFGAGPGGIHVFSPDGKHLGSIETGVPTGNLAWGEDGSTLFITSNSNVFRLKLTTKGAGF